MSADVLRIRGARQHNLRNIDVDIPRHRLTVITGRSGSGKSSLAFDTIYAEGQRRYVESLGIHVRRFLERLPKPDVDAIDGLSPAICVQQRPPGRSPRSTVGTVTEIYDYLRLLYSRVGRPHCPTCDRPLCAQTVQEMVDLVLAMDEGTRFAVLAPIVRGRRGSFRDALRDLRLQGYVRVRVDGTTVELCEGLQLDGRTKHSVDVYVDRLTVDIRARQRVAESLELALSLGGGMVRIVPSADGELLLSERHACVECGVSLPVITPGLFSFNSHEGACAACGGLGETRRYVADLVIPDAARSVAQGAVAPWGKPGGPYHRHMVHVLSEALDVDLACSWEELTEATRDVLLNGSPGGSGFEGILPGLERRAQQYARRKREEGADEDSTFEYIEEHLGRFAEVSTCQQCAGARLRPEALAVRLGAHSLTDLTTLPVGEVLPLLDALDLSSRERAVAERILHDVLGRLRFLVDVGLDYVSLDRRASTLSGGESQRIRLATQIGAGLVGVLYVLDEPTFGLHSRDIGRLIDTLKALRDRGNTVIVVEHDPKTIEAADHVVDLGPGAGKHGGCVVVTGSPEEIAGDPRSLTGAYLSGRRRVDVPSQRRRGCDAIRLRGVRLHNLRSIDVDVPLRCLTVVTGVSGSGKSSLIIDTLLPFAQAALSGRPLPGHATVGGLASLRKVVAIDQSPIGRTPRSNPATYTRMFKPIRELFAGLPEARARGYRPSRFSFNVKGGRCEACQGAGLVRVEMHFLADVYVECEQCHGARYNRETLEVCYRGASIADVLRLSVEDALGLLGAIPSLKRGLETLGSIGLGYLELGQSATTLSGGEAQRIKLSRELSRRATGHTLYVLDEPTTGLHFADVEMLVVVLGRLVDAGNTVVVIEHDLEIIKLADHVIDLGPEGGARGGQVVASGTPEHVATLSASHTGRALRAVL